MVALVSYTALDMRAEDDANDFLADGRPSVTKTRVTIADGNDKVIYYGKFTPVGSHSISGGTITGVDVVENGKLVGTFRETKINVMTLVSLNDNEVQHWMETSLFKGADSITGSKYSDKLYGWGGNDTIKGLAGNDRLSGGSGKDKLYGGSGKDIFDINKTSESGASSSSRDVIADFVRGTDKLDISGIDASTTASGNNSFNKLISASASFTAARQLKFDHGVLYGNTDSDAAAEFSIQLTGISKLALSDFVL